MLQEYAKNIIDIAIHFYFKNLHNFAKQIIKQGVIIYLFYVIFKFLFKY